MIPLESTQQKERLADVWKGNHRQNGHHGLRVVSWSADRPGPILFKGYMGIRYVVMPMREPIPT